MRPLAAGVALCCCWIASDARGETLFPYRAHISADDVYVRSGPGQSYYPTDKLKVGQQVEVYRHDPGGWCVVRPPTGSFCWVSGRFLTPGVENLAVVTEDNIAARVGSRFSDIRDVVQVRLDKGEVVELLEAKTVGAGSSKQTWYKIAPPQGDFRWVAGKYVDRDYPADGLRKTAAAGAGAVVSTAARSDPPAATAVEAVSPPPLRPAAEQSPLVVDTPDPVPVGNAPIAYPPGYGSAGSRSLTPEKYRVELDEIDSELSKMVAEEPTVWAFGDVRLRTEQLFDMAQTAVQRGRARVLLNKIRRFEEIKQRHEAISATRVARERSDRRTAAAVPAKPEVPLPRRWQERFDGAGVLTEVRSSKAGAPRYALLGESGEVLCYVSPALGVNLRHYLGHQVGVNGNKAYVFQQRAPHVMAKHVNLLDERRR